MNPVGLDYLTLFGMHPVQFVETAAQAGAETIALPPHSMEPLPQGAARYSLLEDEGLCRDVRDCLRANGVRMAMLDGLAVWPGRSVSDYERSMDQLADMGVRLINTVSFDGFDRSLGEFEKLVDLAARWDMEVLLESCPVLTVRTLEQALGVVRRIGRDNFGIMIDTMHVCRTGEAELVAGLEPELVGYVQISDAPRAMPVDDAAYMEEALYDRQIPGEGELPLKEILSTILPDVVVSAEVPLRSKWQEGWTPLQCAETVVSATRRLLTECRPIS